MIKLIIINLLIPLISFSSDAFIINLKDRSVKVQSPKTKQKISTVTIINETHEIIYASLRTKRNVLKRIRINENGKKGATQTLSFHTPKDQVVEFVSLSPSFQSIPLKYNQKTYEIP